MSPDGRVYGLPAGFQFPFVLIRELERGPWLAVGSGKYDNLTSLVDLLQMIQGREDIYIVFHAINVSMYRHRKQPMRSRNSWRQLDVQPRVRYSKKKSNCRSNTTCICKIKKSIQGLDLLIIRSNPLALTYASNVTKAYRTASIAGHNVTEETNFFAQQAKSDNKSSVNNLQSLTRKEQNRKRRT